MWWKKTILVYITKPESRVDHSWVLGDTPEGGLRKTLYKRVRTPGQGAESALPEGVHKFANLNPA